MGVNMSRGLGHPRPTSQNTQAVIESQVLATNRRIQDLNRSVSHMHIYICGDIIRIFMDMLKFYNYTYGHLANSSFKIWICCKGVILCIDIFEFITPFTDRLLPIHKHIYGYSKHSYIYVMIFCKS